MTSSFLRVLSVVGLIVAPAIFLDTLAKATLLLVLALLLCVAMRRSSAASKHYLLGLTMAGLCLIPILSTFGPQLRVLPASWTLALKEQAPPPAESPLSENAPPSEAMASSPVDTPSSTNVLTTTRDVPPSTTNPTVVVQNELPLVSPDEIVKSNEETSRSWLPIVWQSLAALWLLGCTMMLARLALAMFRLRWTASRAKAIDGASWLALAQRLGKSLGTSRQVRLVESNQATMPMTWGVWRPNILLPADCEKWSDERKRVVLLHELAHIQRYDSAWLMLTEVVRALYWFHPLVWLAARQMTAYRERACDDRVLAAGHKATDYAEHLLHIAAHNSKAMLPCTAAIGMARANQLESRIRLILDAARNRADLSRKLASGLALLLAAIVIPLAMLRAAEPDGGDDSMPHEHSDTYSLEEIIAGVQERRKKYRNAEFQITYQSHTEGIAGTIPYVLRLQEKGLFTIRNGDWFCETTRNPPTQCLGPWRDRRWHVDNVRVTEREFQAQEDVSPYTTHLSYNSHRIPFHLDNTLVRAVYGPDEWLIDDWRKFAKEGQLTIEEKKVDGIDCVVVTAGSSGKGIALAPQYDWALIDFYRVKTSDYQCHGEYWLPNTITEENGNFEGEPLTNRVIIENVELAEPLEKKTDIALPQPTAGTKVKVSYPYWRAEWDDVPVANYLVVRGADNSADRFVWPPDGVLTEKDQRIWDLSQHWRDRSIIDDAIETGKPLPFLAENGSEIIWASYNKETKRLKRVEGSKSSTRANSADLATISGKIVFEDGSPATVEGQMYYNIRYANGNGASGTDERYTDKFSLEMKPGTLWLTYYAEGYAPVWTDKIELAPGEERDDTQLILKPGISEMVRVVDEEGQSVAGATVVAHPEIHNMCQGPIFKHTTDDNGEVLLQHLASTRYQLKITAPGYQPLQTAPLRVEAGETLRPTMVRSNPTEGIIRFADGTPAPNTKLRAIREWRKDGKGAVFGNEGKGFWGTTLATTDSRGRFRLDQLSNGSQYLFVIEAVDGVRAVVDNLHAGQEEAQIVLPQRQDLVVYVKGDISKLPQRKGKPFISIRQPMKAVRPDGSTFGELVGEDATLEEVEGGGRVIFRGLAVDLREDAPKQTVRVSLGYDREMQQAVNINPDGGTVVQFEIPNDTEKDIKAAVKEGHRLLVLPGRKLTKTNDISDARYLTPERLIEWSPEGKATEWLLLDADQSPLFTDRDVESAQVKPAEGGKDWHDVAITLTENAGKRMRARTSELLEDGVDPSLRLVTLLDNKVLLAPRLMSVISQECELTGIRSREQAQVLNEVLGVEAKDNGNDEAPVDQPDHTTDVGSDHKQSGTIRGRVIGLPDAGDDVKYSITLDYAALEQARQRRRQEHLWREACRGRDGAFPQRRHAWKWRNQLLGITCSQTASINAGPKQMMRCLVINLISSLRMFQNNRPLSPP